MSKTVELPLKWWDITFQTAPFINECHYRASIRYGLIIDSGPIHKTEQADFKTFEDAKKWIDEELNK